MQLLLIRHALPRRSQPGEGADPDLSDIGRRQVLRLPAALARYPIARVVSSPQRRAVQTAEPVAGDRGLTVDVDERFAEYDRDLPGYLPIEELRHERPNDWARMAQGMLPVEVDEAAFRDRVRRATAAVVGSADPAQTVAVVSHGGVINTVLHEILGTARLLAFPIDYASVTLLRYSRSGRATVATVNGIEHVWDLLPRNRGRLNEPSADTGVSGAAPDSV